MPWQVMYASVARLMAESKLLPLRILLQDWPLNPRLYLLADRK